VIAPGTQFRKLAANRLEGSPLASMAVSGGTIFISTQENLYRLEQRQGSKPSTAGARGPSTVDLP